MSETSSGKFRKKKTYYSQVSNFALRDNNLSLKAKGLYALIQSYITIENFVLYKSYLITLCQEGKQAFNSAWSELKNKGYLLQFKIKSDKGYFEYEYELLDKPSKDYPDTENRYTDNQPLEIPDLDNPKVEQPYVENSSTINITNNNNKNINTKKVKTINFNYEENTWYKTFREKTNDRISLYQLRALAEESSKHQNTEFTEVNDNILLNHILNAYHFILNTKKSELIISNKQIPTKLLKEKVLSYTYFDILNILRNLSATTKTEITNTNYYISVLINYSP